MKKKYFCWFLSFRRAFHICRPDTIACDLTEPVLFIDKQSLSNFFNWYSALTLGISEATLLQQLIYQNKW